MHRARSISIGNPEVISLIAKTRTIFGWIPSLNKKPAERSGECHNVTKMHRNRGITYNVIPKTRITLEEHRALDCLYARSRNIVLERQLGTKSQRLVPLSTGRTDS